jgi:hypothetical protein
MYQQELIELSRAGVRYLVIGAVALGLSGYPRATLDLDLFVDLSEENLDRLLRVLGQMGYKPRAPVDPAQLKDPEERRKWIQDKHAKVFAFHQTKKPLSQIDVLLESLSPRLGREAGWSLWGARRFGSHAQKTFWPSSNSRQGRRTGGTSKF